MVKTMPKEVSVETIEEAIKAIRNNRISDLFEVRMDRIDKLLAAYDLDHNAVRDLVPACAGLLKRAEAAEAELREAIIKLKRIADAGPVINAQIDIAIHQHELDRMADEGCPHA
jgi:hypothetical protein